MIRMRKTQSVTALAFGYFVVGIGAFAVTGLLNEIARELRTSVEGAGQLMSAYSLALAVGAPLLAPLTRRFERRALITAGLVSFGVLQLAAAAAPGYGALATARILAGLAAAVVTPHSIAAAGLAAPPGRSGKAISTMFSGFTLSIVIGIPAGNALGAILGWRATLGLVGAMSIGAAVWTRLALPAKLPNVPIDWTAWRSLAGNAVVLWLLVTTVLQCAGQFTLYTYLAPEFTASLGVGARGAGLLFGWFGVAGLAGNYVASRVIDRVGAARVVDVCLALMIAAFAMWPLASGSLMMTMLATLIWGLCGFAIHPSQQARLVAVAPHLASASAALNLSATYLGQMFGSALGGGLISWVGAVALAWGGAVLLVAASGALIAAGRSQAIAAHCEHRILRR
jgi:predicted MFS family arabinose efflux permease